MLPTRTQSILDEIDTLRHEQTKLYGHLRRSLQIARLWPDAFKDKQTCQPVLIGTNAFDRSIISKAKAYPPPFENVKTIKRTFLRRQDGVEKDLTPEEFFSIFEGPVDEPDQADNV